MISVFLAQTSVMSRSAFSGSTPGSVEDAARSMTNPTATAASNATSKSNAVYSSFFLISPSPSPFCFPWDFDYYNTLFTGLQEIFPQKM